MDNNHQYEIFDNPEGDELTESAPDPNRSMEHADNPAFDELDVQDEYQDEMYYEEPQEHADGYPDVVLYDDEYAEEPEYMMDPEGVILEEEIIYEADGEEAKTSADTGKGMKIKRIKAPKTTSERSRFYNLPADQKQHYHQNRVERVRRERVEATHILSIPANQATPEIIAKAQEILDKQSKETEKQKLRFQNFTVDERQEYRRKQAEAAKKRKQQEEVYDPNDPYGVFAEMERDVVQKTKKAWKKIMEQNTM